MRRRVLLFALLVALGALLHLRSTGGRARPAAAPLPDATRAAARRPELRPPPAPPRATPERARPAAVAAPGQAPASAGSRAPSAVRGRVVDARTGEAVPGFELQVAQGEFTAAPVTTDRAGAFATEPSFRPGTLAVQALDESALESERAPLEFAVDDLDVEQTLEVEVGPTYRLDVRAPAPLTLAEFDVLISSATEGSRANPDSYYRTPIRPADEVVDRPWVRLNPGVLHSVPLGPWRLELVSKDGFHYGAAPVDSVVGVYPEVVRVTISARGALRVTARDTAGAPVQARVLIERLADRARRHSPWAGASEHELAALEPGRWLVLVEAYEHEPLETEVEVVAGRTEALDAVLRPLAVAGDVRGEVTSATGTFAGAGEVALWTLDSFTLNRRSRLDWVEEEGRRVARFAFEDVPAGAFDLVLILRECHFEVLPGRTRTVSAPAPDVAFHVVDDVPVLPVEFRVRDPRTGQAVPAGAWWLAPDGWAGFRPRLEPGAFAVDSWPVGSELDWLVRVPGGAVVAGTERDLAREGDRLVALVTDRPGWGLQLFLHDPEGAELVGVTLAFDGVAFGPSGPRGRIVVDLPRAPTSLEVRTPGWRLPGGATQTSALAFDMDNWWAIGFELEPADD